MKITTNWAVFSIKLNRALTARNEQLAREALMCLQGEILSPEQKEIVKRVKVALTENDFKYGELFRTKVQECFRNLEKDEQFKIECFEIPRFDF
jgi:hypothetical protein